MEAIVSPHGRRTRDEWVAGHMTSLLAALYLYVWNTVNMPNGVDEARYVKARKNVVETLEQARETISVKDVEEEEQAWEGWQDIHAEDIDDAAITINRRGWLESDWAKGIQDLIQREQDHDAEKTVGKGIRDPVGTVRRTDTMLQEKYDYLSDKRRKDYAAWERTIMKEITRLEAQSQAVEAMQED
jgi:origin recognition complex subunit 6